MKKMYTNFALVCAILLVSGAMNAQTSIPGSRLIAQSLYSVSGLTFEGYDSSLYIYPSDSTLLYNEKDDYNYTGSAWYESRINNYTYNSTGKLTYSVFQNWDAGSSSFINGGMMYFTLNDAGYCIRDSSRLWIPSSSAYRDNTRDIYTYNDAGQITDQEYDSWEGGTTLIPYFHFVNTYNTEGKPLTMLVQDWDADIHWMDDSKTTYTYDASGVGLQTITGENAPSDGEPMVKVYQTTYTLNTDGTIASYLEELWNTASSTYKPYMNGTMTYDADGNNTLETQGMWDAGSGTYKPYQQYARTYNTHHQMTSETRLLWNDTTSTYSIYNEQYNYYYEDYVTTGVNSIHEEDASLSLVPIPTTGDLHIVLNWAEPQAFTATIVDAAGRTCYTFSSPSVKQYTDNINISNMPSGQYFMVIHGADGKNISRSIILQR